jgi:hypothetical protein
MRHVHLLFSFDKSKLVFANAKKRKGIMPVWTAKAGAGKSMSVSWSNTA